MGERLLERAVRTDSTKEELGLGEVERRELERRELDCIPFIDVAARLDDVSEGLETRSMRSGMTMQYSFFLLLLC